VIEVCKGRETVTMRVKDSKRLTSQKGNASTSGVIVALPFRGIRSADANAELRFC